MGETGITGRRKKARFSYRGDGSHRHPAAWFAGSRGFFVGILLSSRG